MWPRPLKKGVWSNRFPRTRCSLHSKPNITSEYNHITILPSSLLTQLTHTSMSSDPYEEIDVLSPPPHPPLPDGDPPPIVRSNPLYSPDEQDGAQVWVNPQYNRLAQSDEPVALIGNLAAPVDDLAAPIGNLAAPVDDMAAPIGDLSDHSGSVADPMGYPTQPDASITLQGGSLPHVANTEPMTEAEAVWLRVRTPLSVSHVC